MTQLKTKNEKLEYTNDEKKKLVLEINTGDAEKVTEWYNIVKNSKLEFGSDLAGAKEELKRLMDAILEQKTFEKIVKFCNNNFMCILKVVLDVVEVVIKAQLGYKEEVDKRMAELNKLK